jgi:segregation and condensation protein B
MRELTRQLEALLFVSGRPVSLSELSTMLTQPVDSLEPAALELQRELEGRGVQLARSGDALELVTDPAFGALLEPFVATERQRPLSAAALETLAIVLYRQPVTKAIIDQTRGISSDQSLSSLIERGLVVEAGVSVEAGKPMRYRPSPTALRELGITDIAQLPPLEEPRHAS